MAWLILAYSEKRELSFPANMPNDIQHVALANIDPIYEEDIGPLVEMLIRHLTKKEPQ